MSLAYLKIHFVRERLTEEALSRIIERRLRDNQSGTITKTACGRWAPGWARMITYDPDYVTCEPCLDVLVQETLRALAREGILIEEKYA